MFVVCFVLKESFYALTGFLQLSENLTRLETLKLPFYAFFELFKFSSVSNSLELWIIFS